MVLTNLESRSNLLDNTIQYHLLNARENICCGEMYVRAKSMNEMIICWGWKYNRNSVHVNYIFSRKNINYFDPKMIIVWCYNYINITFYSGWYGIFSPRGKVLVPEASPRATVPFQGKIICHITLNKMWQLLYYIILWTIAIWQFTVQNCMCRFFPCDMACDSSKYHPANWPIWRQERQVICNNNKRVYDL